VVDNPGKPGLHYFAVFFLLAAFLAGAFLTAFLVAFFIRVDSPYSINLTIIRIAV
jgi:hypothetical protein